MKRSVWVVMVAIALFCLSGQAIASEKVLKMSTTTSTDSSGLLDVLLPEFTKDTGVKVQVIAAGTGAAIRHGQGGNVDIIFVHARAREDKFVAEGYGTKRYAVMHNDFVILGPPSDPAAIKGMKDSAAALKKIAAAKAGFVSRGDDSGTHTKEQQLWESTALPLVEQTQVVVKKGKKIEITSHRPAAAEEWYDSIGQGMGKTITKANEKLIYTLADRGTFIKRKYGTVPAIDLEVLCDGDEPLANPYGIIPVNPAKFDDGAINHELAVQFAEWITSARGQKLIGDYRLEGKQLFYPDAIM